MLSFLKFKNNDKVNCEVFRVEFDKRHVHKYGNYFLYLPLEEQLIQLVKSKYYKEFIRINDEESDIISGKYYKTLIQENIIGDNDITIQWLTDRIKTFNSARSSIFAILLQISDLPYRLRKGNIVCCGVWFISKNPPMNLFLKCNGKHGSSYCIILGKAIPYGKGFTRIYCGDKHQRRSMKKYNGDCQKIVDDPNTEDVNGVKGSSIAQLLPIFHIIWSFPPDYLHSVTEGVTELFVDTWFDYANHVKAWYLGRYAGDIDNLLLRMKPPCAITRCPRSVTERALWNASEWKNFLLYYSLICFYHFCLKNIMNIRSYSCTVFRFFLQLKMNEDNFIAASAALRLFVLRIESLYGKEYMKYNVHILLHIP